MRKLLSLVLLPLFAACGDDTPAKTDTLSPDTADTAAPPDGDVADSSEPPDVDDAADLADTSPPEDTGSPDGDTGGTSPIVAVAGARCDLTERVGLVELEAMGAQVYLTATLSDRPDPWYAAPELTTDQCAFHRFVAATCPPCGEGEICGRDGACVLPSLPVAGASVAVLAGEQRETFSAEEITGQIWGEVKLTGELGLEIGLGNHRITVAPGAIPGTLKGLDGSALGTTDAPEQVDITWAPAEAGTHVYTLVPINHHAGGPTFTECAVPVTAGAMRIEEDMLAPLAIITGLEFQTVQHVRFAAAETPAGCVEIRYLTREFIDIWM